MLAIPIRDDTPIRRPPVVTWALIVACASVFLWQASLPSRVADRISLEFGMIPAVLFGETQLPVRLRVVPAWLTPVTSMFLHGGWLHLIGNMLFLGLFGRGVESALGSVRFGAVYLLCGIAAAVTQAAINPAETVPMIGASGAIAGVLGAYLLLFPRANVDVFIWIVIFVRLISVPAVILLGLWFLIQLVSALGADPTRPGVAFWAHVGGFGAGLVLVGLFGPRRTGSVGLAGSPAFRIRRVGRYAGGSVPRAGLRRRGPWDR
jgi:membrane associated rhomboid family serine protease